MNNVFSIDAPHFNAGGIYHNGAVVKAAPILKYMVGWRESAVMAYCKKKAWDYVAP